MKKSFELPEIVQLAPCKVCGDFPRLDVLDYKKFICYTCWANNRKAKQIREENEKARIWNQEQAY